MTQGKRPPGDDAGGPKKLAKLKELLMAASRGAAFVAGKEGAEELIDLFRDKAS